LGIQKIYTALEFGSKKTLCYWIARNDWSAPDSPFTKTPCFWTVFPIIFNKTLTQTCHLIANLQDPGSSGSSFIIDRVGLHSVSARPPSLPSAPSPSRIDLARWYFAFAWPPLPPSVPYPMRGIHACNARKWYGEWYSPSSASK
jgi:hypothetical protein